MGIYILYITNSALVPTDLIKCLDWFNDLKNSAFVWVFRLKVLLLMSGIILYCYPKWQLFQAVIIFLEGEERRKTRLRIKSELRERVYIQIIYWPLLIYYSILLINVGGISHNPCVSWHMVSPEETKIVALRWYNWRIRAGNITVYTWVGHGRMDGWTDGRTWSFHKPCLFCNK
jgi:hypothetical protein